MRSIQKIYRLTPAIEGAGVHLKRGFSNQEAEAFDPFLLFDDFSNKDAQDYEAGFPTHPHRGIETVTYILEGEVAHKDSLGNKGVIQEGQIQWMTAGSGIIHEEMPLVHEEGIQGFQLWVNLPREHKMMVPRYQDISPEHIPTVQEEGRDIRVIAGAYGGKKGPIQDLMVAPTYLDVALDAETTFSYGTSEEDTFFAYVFRGSLVTKHAGGETWVNEGDIALFSKGDSVALESGKEGARLLLIGGTPLKEPIAWYGPIVMNTKEEIETALADLQKGTFIK